MREGAAGDAAAPFHVAVVGGGISGLSTAWYVEKQAAAQGVPVVCSVYESAGRWGGRILTDIVDREEGRFVVEGGPDSFLTTGKPWAVDLAAGAGSWRTAARHERRSPQGLRAFEGQTGPVAGRGLLAGSNQVQAVPSVAAHLAGRQTTHGT